MFTGIVKEIGEVKSMTRKGGRAVLEVVCDTVREGLEIGDSVAVNGVCLSVTNIGKTVSFDVVGNTLEKTGLKRLRVKDRVNLENALRLGDTLSGHMVSGHIDTERVIRDSRRSSKGWILDISLLGGDKKYLVPKGSVAVDGISLTVGEIYNDFFRIFLIPHTLDNTILKLKKSGDYVNLEFDMMGKYAGRDGSESRITMDMLKDKGFV